MTATITVWLVQTDQNAAAARRRRHTGVPVRQAVRPALHAIPVHLIQTVPYPADMPVFQESVRKNVRPLPLRIGVLPNRHVRPLPLLAGI